MNPHKHRGPIWVVLTAGHKSQRHRSTCSSPSSLYVANLSLNSASGRTSISVIYPC